MHKAAANKFCTAQLAPQANQEPDSEPKVNRGPASGAKSASVAFGGIMVPAFKRWVLAINEQHRGDRRDPWSGIDLRGRI